MIKYITICIILIIHTVPILWGQTNNYADIALYRTVEAVTGEYGGQQYPGRNAVDNDDTTAWGAPAKQNGTPITQDIIIALSKPRIVNKVEIHWYGNFYADSFSVSYSSNKRTWAVIEAITGNTELINEIIPVTPPEARYIKVSCTSPNKTYYAIRTIKVLQEKAALVGNAGFTPAQAKLIDLKADTAGMLYIAYQDWSNDRKASVMRHTNNAWQQVGPGPVSDGEVMHLSQAIHGTTPYLAYIAESPDGSEKNTLRVKKYINGTWQTVGDLSCYYATRDISLAITKNNPSGSDPTLYLAYIGPDEKPVVMQYGADAVWRYFDDNRGAQSTHGRILPEKSDHISWSVELVLDENDTPYLAVNEGDPGYTGQTPDNPLFFKKRMSIRRFTGTRWETMGLPLFTPTLAQDITLAVSTTQMDATAFPGVKTVYAGCRDLFTGNKISLWKLSVNTHATSDTPAYYFKPFPYGLGLSDRFGAFPVLTLHNGTDPYVVYCDDGNDGTVTVKGMQGTIKATGYFSTGKAEFTSVVIHNNVMYIAYCDWTRGGGATVVSHDLSVVQ